MAVGRGDDRAVGLLREGHVVNITALAGNEAMILDPAHRLTDAKLAYNCIHGISPLREELN